MHSQSALNLVVPPSSLNNLITISSQREREYIFYLELQGHTHVIFASLALTLSLCPSPSSVFPFNI